MESDLLKDIDYNAITKKCIPIVFQNEEIEVLGIYLKYKDKLRGEYRSKGDINVATLAKIFSGWEHVNASGFTSKKSI